VLRICSLFVIGFGRLLGDCHLVLLAAGSQFLIGPGGLYVLAVALKVIIGGPLIDSNYLDGD